MIPVDFEAVTTIVTSKQALLDVSDPDSSSTESQSRSLAKPSTCAPVTTCALVTGAKSLSFLLPESMPIDAVTTSTKESITTDAGVPAGTAVIAPIDVLGVSEGELDGDTLGKLELGVREGGWENPGRVGTELRLGNSVGASEGTSDGDPVGGLDGTSDGDPAGVSDGTADGEMVGSPDGTSDGIRDGNPVGAPDGTTDGDSVGASDGTTDGCLVGANDGSTDGDPVGAPDGTTDGELVGASLGGSDDD